ncbi:DUF4276 family protein [Geovibrio ferrireducens]|uniref:DUF4276 family protein n=1 Tax=Geovibrio ferrireducens TaxID=46201 RepID=UPI0022458D6D|nr:DUF4276 family protein [Geovibrio ferrireducens]
MKIKIYVEGGGNNNKYLEIECRKAFKLFFEKAGFVGMMPSVIPCGRRNQAYRDFCTSVRTDNQEQMSLLLVDSEDAAPQRFEDVWSFLKERETDNWQKPDNAEDKHAHLMVVCMETWLISDKNALEKYYGKNFKVNTLPKRPDVENIAKSDLYQKLKLATKDTQKGEYSKGGHSFELLGLIDPQLVFDASPWATRLIDELKKHLNL